MTDKHISRADEAKNLANEAIEAIQQDDADEGKFLADAARALDKDAAAEVLAGKHDPETAR